MRNRIVDIMHGRGLEFRIRKNLFRKFFISPIRKNEVKYKFPGIRYETKVPHPRTSVGRT